MSPRIIAGAWKGRKLIAPAGLETRPTNARARQAAFDMLYRSNLNVTQALVELQQKFHIAEIEHLVTFIRESKRGICRGADGKRGDEEE